MAKAPASRSPPRKCPSCWPSTGPWMGGPGRKQGAQPLLSHPYRPPAQCMVRQMRRGRNGVGGAGQTRPCPQGLALQSAETGTQ